jgi:hypothetical protein
MDNILISHFKIEKDQSRNDEILSCIRGNLELDFFNEVRLLIEGVAPKEFAEELLKVQTKSKLTVENVEKRLTYKEIFKICNYEPNKTFYLTNADIAYDESLQKIKLLEDCLSEGVVLAQHRYNLIPKTTKIVFEKTPPIAGQHYSGSADAFIFNTPIEFAHEFNFFGGTSYCDQHLSSLLSKSGRLCISINDIICEHRHSSKINETGRVTEEDYACTINNNCKKTLTNADIKYNPILATKEMLSIFSVFRQIKDSNLKNLEFLCQTFLKHKHGAPQSPTKDPKKEILALVDSILDIELTPEAFSKTLAPQPVFQWQGFPNPHFILKSRLDDGN